MAENGPIRRFGLEAISERHDVERFDCQHTFLNDFLRADALPEFERGLSRTFVLLDHAAANPNAVVGYYTLRADCLYQSKPGRSVPLSIPVVELAYLARDTAHQGRGLGDLLLVSSFQAVRAAAEWIGIGGLHLTPTQQGRKLYERYGFQDHPYGPDWLFLPIADLRAILETSA